MSCSVSYLWSSCMRGKNHFRPVVNEELDSRECLSDSCIVSDRSSDCLAQRNIKINSHEDFGISQQIWLLLCQLLDGFLVATDLGRQTSESV